MNAIEILTIEQSIPEGDDFQNWIFKIRRVLDKIRPSLIVRFYFRSDECYRFKLQTYPKSYKSIFKLFLSDYKSYFYKCGILNDNIHTELCKLYKIERKEELRVKRNERAREKRRLKREEKLKSQKIEILFIKK